MLTINNGIVTMSEQEYYDLRLPQIQYTSTSNPSLVKAPSFQPNLEQIVTDYLHLRGFKHNLQGFNYIRKAIIQCVDKPNTINKIIVLYKKIAFEDESTGSRVERSIRHAIESSSVEKVANSEFIAMVSDEIRLTIKAAVS